MEPANEKTGGNGCIFIILWDETTTSYGRAFFIGRKRFFRFYPRSPTRWGTGRLQLDVYSGLPCVVSLPVMRRIFTCEAGIIPYYKNRKPLPLEFGIHEDIGRACWGWAWAFSYRRRSWILWNFIVFCCLFLHFQLSPFKCQYRRYSVRFGAGSVLCKYGVMYRKKSVRLLVFPHVVEVRSDALFWIIWPVVLGRVVN